MNQQSLNTRRTPRVTVEAALWMLIAFIALALRLSHLDAAPLNAREAHEAMLAWGAVTGQGMPQAGYSPLLFVANGLMFALCGASDVLARLWPALFGSALALTPLLFREHIGRVGAVAAGLCLALSPTALLASRQLDGAVVAAVGGMAFLGGLVRFSDTGARAWLILSAVGLALAVTSSSSAYGLLLTLGLAWLVCSLLTLRDPRDAQYVTHIRWALRITPVFLLTGLALSTGLGWNPAGLGAAGDLLLAWLARFGPAPDPVVSPLTLLVVYEPLVSILGVGGLVWSIRRRHRFGAMLGLWAGAGVLLLALTPGRAPFDVLWVVLPLAMLTGVAVEALVRSLRERGEWPSEGLYILVVMILWVHFYLMLARYSTTFGESTDLALALLVVALQILLAITFALAIRFDIALRAVAVGTGVALLAATVSAGWGTAIVRPADPRELLVREPTAVEVRDLVQTLRDLSWRETAIPTTLPLTLEAAPDSVLSWYLRDFSAVRRVESLDAHGEVEPVLVTDRRDLDGLVARAEADAPDDTEFVGQDFALRRSWAPVEINCAWEWPPRCQAAAGWLLFRHTPSPPVVDQWSVLWLSLVDNEGQADLSHSH